MANGVIKNELSESYVIGANVELTMDIQPYTAPCDGFFNIVKLGAYTTESVIGYVDGIQVMQLPQISSPGYPSMSIFVKKGMRLSSSSYIVGSTGASFRPIKVRN